MRYSIVQEDVTRGLGCLEREWELAKKSDLARPRFYCLSEIGVLHTYSKMRFVSPGETRCGHRRGEDVNFGGYGTQGRV